jgi:2-iminoacetate synthase
MPYLISTFSEEVKQAQQLLSTATESEVRAAIYSEEHSLQQLSLLLSPVAGKFLEEIAQRASQITRRFFGKTISLYVPLYLSNHCVGGCAYCGFAADRKIKRKKLDKTEILKEMTAIKKMGFEDILLLTGERTPEADFDYVLEAVKMAADMFSMVSIETFPMTVDEYAALAEAGCAGVTMYQETYDEKLYAQLHRWGPKKDFLFRFTTPERAAQAGIRQIGLGVLLGLGEPFSDLLQLFLHIRALQKIYWQTGFSVSFPRLRPEVGNFKACCSVSDKALAQFIWAFRICLPQAHLTLSTRESSSFRNGIAGIGITKMSAGSRTSVGGYLAKEQQDDGQFQVNDARDVSEICDMLKKKKLEPVFKNWDAAFR